MNMEATEANYKLSLKLLVDTNSNKVLYAEANKDFVDFLFSMLSLPIATVINLLKTTAKHDDEEMVGCIGYLYKSIEALSSDFMQPNITKDSVLNPTIVSPPNFFLPNHHSPPDNVRTSTKKFYACSNSTSFALPSNFGASSAPCFSSSPFRAPFASDFSSFSSASAFASRSGPDFCFSPSRASSGLNSSLSGINSDRSCNYVSDVPITDCPGCKRVMSRELKFIAPKSSNSVDMASPSSSGYVKGVATYMVMDNLEVTPLSTVSALTLMSKSHVRDVASLVGKHVQVGPNEGVKILKASLETQAVLTTVFLKRGHSFHGTAPDFDQP